MPEGRLACVQMNGRPRTVKLHTPVDADTLERLAHLTFMPSGGVHVCHHVPTSPEGVEFYRRFVQRSPEGAARAAYTVFETDSIPRLWIDPLNEMDEVWVPTRFNVETFARAGVQRDKLHVIPHGFDPRAYRPEETPPLIVGEAKGFNFLSIFEWTHRKGWDVLLRAYLEEFSPEEDVRLILRAYQGGGVVGAFRKPVLHQLEDHIRHLGRDPKRIPDITFLDRMVPADAMPALYRAADAFVLPTRGEGWGIPFTESMLMEVPVIATRWSGHLEFMNDENAYLVNVERLVPVGMEQVADNPFYAGHRWAEPSVTHLRSLMRHVFEHREEGREKGRAGRAHVLGRFTIHHAALAVAKRVRFLEEIARRRRRAWFFLSVPVEEGAARPSGEASPDKVSPAPDSGNVPRMKGGSGRSFHPLSDRTARHVSRRMLFCIRPDLFQVPRADTFMVRRLKDRLEAAGWRVDVTSHPETDLKSYDLVHLFCMDARFALYAALQRTPFVAAPLRTPSLGPDVSAFRACSVLMEESGMDRGTEVVERLKACEDSRFVETALDYGFILDHASAVLARGPEEARALRRCFPACGPVEILPPAGDGMEERPAAEGDPPEVVQGLEAHVLCTAPLHPLENPLMVLHALRNEAIPLVFADGGRNDSVLEKQCKAYRRAGKTVFTGSVHDADRGALFDRARVHLSAGWITGVEPDTVEAARRGCAVVLPEGLDVRTWFGEDAFYCDPGDPESIRRAVREAYAAGPSAGLAERAASFTWEALSERLGRLYETVLEREAEPAAEARHRARAAAAEEEIRFLELKRAVRQAVRRAPGEGIRLAEKLREARGRDDAGLLGILGTACLLLERYDEAAVHFQAALALQPLYNPQAYLGLALALLCAGRHGEASAVLLEGAELHPLAPPETRELFFGYLRRAVRGPTSAAYHWKAGCKPPREAHVPAS